MRGPLVRALNNSAVECRVLWNQLPELGENHLPGADALEGIAHSRTNTGTFMKNPISVARCDCMMPPVARGMWVAGTTPGPLRAARQQAAGANP